MFDGGARASRGRYCSTVFLFEQHAMQSKWNHLIMRRETRMGSCEIDRFREAIEYLIAEGFHLALCQLFAIV